MASYWRGFCRRLPLLAIYDLEKPQNIVRGITSHGLHFEVAHLYQPEDDQRLVRLCVETQENGSSYELVLLGSINAELDGCVSCEQTSSTARVYQFSHSKCHCIPQTPQLTLLGPVIDAKVVHYDLNAQQRRALHRALSLLCRIPNDSEQVMAPYLDLACSSLPDSQKPKVRAATISIQRAYHNLADFPSDP